MNRPFVLFALAVVLPIAAGHAQARGAAPTMLRSVDVAADGRVTFRLRAPRAHDATVTIGRTRLAMQKDEQGMWVATSDALTPDYYTYSFIVDSISVKDPFSRDVQTSYGSFQPMFVVPGPEAWFPHSGVPRGAITRHTFHSAIANDDRDFFVYTPPGYDARRKKAYPVLYLLHGLGDDAERWMNFGGANVIMDNLIAQNKAVPMIVVTTLGYGLNTGPVGAMSAENITGYTKILLDEVMPKVDQAYNVTRDRKERAIAGLSMGGAEAVYTGLNHLDTFAWIGSFSGAYVMWPGASGRAGAPETMFAENFPSLDARANSQISMLWIVCGTADGLIGVNRQFKTWLASKNVRFTEQEVPDIGHVWPLWRQNLTDMAQRLFQAKGR